MSSRTIDRREWASFFNQVSDALAGKKVEIEASSLEVGDQIVAEWMPLLGVSYDSKDDLVDISLGEMDLDHLIRNPKDIQVQDGTHGIEMIAVTTAAGSVEMLRLREPLMLPAPAGKP